MEQNPSSSRADRKTIEKNRRDYMKALCLQLNSMVPHQVSREAVTLPDQLEQAENYIKKLRSNLEQMKQKKERKEKPRRWIFQKLNMKEFYLEVILVTQANYGSFSVKPFGFSMKKALR
ncbi:hypothetical protein Leryth_026206 [Lithospermum erythrorhizon]|nr:hypothetical protein Leryth_026206 [Lithospermum erythrorhizon]